MASPPDPRPEPPHPLSTDEALHALAAGELGKGEARALEQRLGREPALAARYEEIRALEARLREESLLDLPAGLVERVRLRTRSRTGTRTGATEAWRTPAPLVRTARFAAAVLLAFLAWLAATSALPVPALAEPTPAIGHALDPARELLPSAMDAATWRLDEAAADAAAPLVLGGAGLVLLVAGLLVAWRLLGRSPVRSPERPT